MSVKKNADSEGQSQTIERLWKIQNEPTEYTDFFSSDFIISVYDSLTRICAVSADNLYRDGISVELCLQKEAEYNYDNLFSIIAQTMSSIKRVFFKCPILHIHRNQPDPVKIKSKH